MAAHRTLVGLFLAMILAPLAANLAGFDGANPRVENRTMAVFPTLEATPASLRAFPGRVAGWFEDHFGFRSTLVRWYGVTRYFWLGVSPSAAVVKGRDGWLFYADDSGMADYGRAEVLREDQVDDWRIAVGRSHAWLRAKGIGFAFTIAPDKHVLYPEELPGTIHPVGTRYRMDQVLEALRSDGIPVVDVRPALLEAKTRERIYEKTDTHWNERGAYAAYRVLVEAIRNQVPAVPPPWPREDFEPLSQRIDAMDLAGMIGLRDVLHEDRLCLYPRRPRLAKTIEPAGEEPSSNVGRLVTEIPGSSLPRAVVFRDSFTARLAPYLSEHFSRVVYLWQDNFETKVIEEERPAVVIEEIVGRHLAYGAPYTNAPQ